MKLIRIQSGQFSQEAVDETVRALNAGEVVLLPTETVYGLMADAQNAGAVERLYSIKGRTKEQALQTMFADIEMAEKYVEMNAVAKNIANKFLPGALTLVVPKKEGIRENVLSGNERIGVRIPSHELCLAVIGALGRPVASTSANMSGMPTERSVDAILAQLGERAGDISIVLDEGELPDREATTVIEILPDRPLHVIREGAVPASDILMNLGSE